ncbi:SDR family NAD(P)-dependent oxidoreductase [Streptomyces sp. L7]
MTELPELSGKVAVITGASRGIGYGVAEALLARGDRVCITGRNEDALKEAVETLGADRVIGVAGKAPTTRPIRPSSSSARWRRFGRVDYLVNNAGTNPVFGPIADLDLNVARKVFETNVISALGFAQKTWHAWQKENGGAIVNIASLAGIYRLAVHRRVRRQQGRDGQPDAPAGARVRARRAGQLHCPGSGEDQVRRRPVRGPRGGGRRLLPAGPAWCAVRHRRRRRVPDVGPVRVDHRPDARRRRRHPPERRSGLTRRPGRRFLCRSFTEPAPVSRYENAHSGLTTSS